MKRKIRVKPKHLFFSNFYPFGHKRNAVKIIPQKTRISRDDLRRYINSVDWEDIDYDLIPRISTILHIKDEDQNLVSSLGEEELKVREKLKNCIRYYVVVEEEKQCRSCVYWLVDEMFLFAKGTIGFLICTGKRNVLNKFFGFHQPHSHVWDNMFDQLHKVISNCIISGVNSHMTWRLRYFCHCLAV